MTKKKPKPSLKGQWVFVVEVRCLLRVFAHKKDAVEWAIQEAQGPYQWYVDHIQRKRIS